MDPKTICQRCKQFKESIESGRTCIECLDELRAWHELNEPEEERLMEIAIAARQEEEMIELIVQLAELERPARIPTPESIGWRA